MASHGTTWSDQRRHQNSPFVDPDVRTAPDQLASTHQRNQPEKQDGSPASQRDANIFARPVHDGDPGDDEQ